MVRIAAADVLRVIAAGNGVVKEDVAAKLGGFTEHICPGLRSPLGFITLLVSFHRPR